MPHFYKVWRHSQVVRPRSAKPLCPSSNLGGASNDPLKGTPVYTGFLFKKSETFCRSGGIGRRTGLKIPRWQHRTGSSPVFGTRRKSLCYLLKRLFLFAPLQWLTPHLTPFVIMKPWKLSKLCANKQGCFFFFSGSSSPVFSTRQALEYKGFFCLIVCRYATNSV